MSIHRRIKERREALNLSMQEVAAACGVSSWQTVQQWEKEGGTAPSRKRVDLVAKVLKVSPEWLVTGREPGKQEGTLQFTELSGPEAQLVMFYRQLSDDKKHELSVVANNMVNEIEPTKKSEANPYAGVEKRSSQIDRRESVRAIESAQVRQLRGDKHGDED